MFFEKKEPIKEVIKVEPLYYYKTINLAVDLSNIDRLNEAFTNGFRLLNHHNPGMVFPKEGIVVLIKEEKIMITEKQ